jgi:hypothetical protein
MSRVSLYFITPAEDRDEAEALVESWLEDMAGREFYDGFDVVTEDVRRVYGFSPGFFADRKRRVQQEITRYAEGMARWEAENNARMVGYCHVCIGHILMESCCHDMPFYNLGTVDWTEPDKDDWAVRVTLHY